MSVALAAVWLMSLAVNAAEMPAMRCERAHMPCCPVSGHNGAHCSAVRCEAQSFQKAENRASVEAAAWRSENHQEVAETNPVRPARRELHTGLRYRASVFGLKDDLRL